MKNLLIVTLIILFFVAIVDHAMGAEQVSGLYQGSLQNTSEQTNLPDRVSITFVMNEAKQLSGSTRLYLGAFGSLEYAETFFSEVSYTSLDANRLSITAKTAEYGLTYQLILYLDTGILDGKVIADGVGEAGKMLLKKIS